MRQKIGEIGVDAGICWIGDPCYVFHKEDDLPKELGKSWEEFCDNIVKMGTHQQFNFDMGHSGLGVLVHTGYGDGCYPVYANIRDGRVMSVTVEFFDD